MSLFQPSSPQNQSPVAMKVLVLYEDSEQHRAHWLVGDPARLRIRHELLEHLQLNVVGEPIVVGEDSRNQLGQTKSYGRFLVDVDLRQRLEQAVDAPALSLDVHKHLLTVVLTKHLTLSLLRYSTQYDTIFSSLRG